MNFWDTHVFDKKRHICALNQAIIFVKDKWQDNQSYFSILWGFSITEVGENQESWTLDIVPNVNALAFLEYGPSNSIPTSDQCIVDLIVELFKLFRGSAFPRRANLVTICSITFNIGGVSIILEVECFVHFGHLVSLSTNCDNVWTLGCDGKEGCNGCCDELHF